MTQRRWLHVFSLRTKNLRITRELSNTCYRCKIDIEIGDNVYSRNTNGRKSKSKIYHKLCAEEVHII